MYAFVSLYAQKINVLTDAIKAPNGNIKCVSMENDKYQRMLHQERGTLEQFELWLTPKIEEYKRNLSNSSYKIQGTVITIPVVVHVIHNGDAVGSGENIADGQVLSQIRVLNEDFRRLLGSPGYNTNAVGADVEVEFCMAQTAPNGQPTNGIDRVQRTEASWTSMTNIDNVLKAATIWDPTQYLNMWTVRFSGGMAGTLGYAQFPDASGLSGLSASGGAATSDGVVASFDAFGSQSYYPAGIYNATYNLGRTMTHEVGHWLGLRHIWGDGDCSVDDFCADTPNAAQANFGCPNINSCTDPAPNPRDMVENYMDYTDDACMNIFTNDQKTRIRTVLTNSPRRMELATSDKCSPPTPTISFATNQTTVNEATDCNYQEFIIPVNISMAPNADATVTFSTTGSATQGLDYTFTPSSVVFASGTTTSKNLTVRIYNDGVVEPTENMQFNMSISTTGNAVITTNSFKSHIFTINDDDIAPAVSKQVNILNVDFESGFGGFTTTGNTGSDKFLIGTAATASSAYWIISNTNTSSFAYSNDDRCNCNKAADRLISPAFSLVGYSNATLVFDQAFAGYTGETANVQISVNGGTWNTLQTITNTSSVDANGIATTPWVNNNTINLNAYVGQTNIKIRFNYNDGGAWLYGLAIDNVRIYSTVNTAVQTLINSSNKDLQPIRNNETTYWFDPVTNNVMASIANTTSWNYGCTSMEVDRDQPTVGTGATAFWNNTSAEYLMAKTYYISPEINSTTGSYSITFYFTDAELTAWETITGKSRNNLKIIKVANTPISTVNSTNYTSYSYEIKNASLGTFGANYTLSANFTTGFSGFGFGDPSITFLPVELIDFNAIKENESVRLNWSTASEENNDYFEIEHSVNAVDFTTIGNINGAGNSSRISNYTFLDEHPVSGYNYYRLKQVDVDGSFQYSKIKSVYFEENQTKTTINIYPNPTTDFVNILFNNKSIQPINIEIIDVLGKVVDNIQNVNLPNGATAYSINVASLSNGFYNIRIIQDQSIFSSPLIKK